MASSEVSEVFTSSFEDERTLNQLTVDAVNDDLYGSDELIVSSEDVPQSEEIVGSSIADTLNDVYVPTNVPDLSAVDLIKKEPKYESTTRIVASSIKVNSMPKSHHHHHELGSLGTLHSPSRIKHRNSPIHHHKNGLESLFHSAVGADIDKETTWQQKRVSIKTLEGEFSVTMWASGTEDGKKSNFSLEYLDFFVSCMFQKSRENVS